MNDKTIIKIAIKEGKKLEIKLDEINRELEKLNKMVDNAFNVKEKIENELNNIERFIDYERNYNTNAFKEANLEYHIEGEKYGN